MGECHVTECAKVNMAELISLEFERVTVGLPTNGLLKSNIARFFNVVEEGLHLKISGNGKIENLWPSANGKFSLPLGTNHATVIAFSEKHQDEDDFVRSSFGARYVLRDFVSVSLMFPSFL